MNKLYLLCGHVNCERRMKLEVTSKVTVVFFVLFSGTSFLLHAYN
jgi:hypothetical protein